MEAHALPQSGGPAPPRPQQATPGWYADPQYPGSQRYWDGQSWGARAASQPPGMVTAPVQQESRALQTVGYILAGLSALFPFLALGGLIIGIIVATKPNKGGHGAAIIVISLVVGFLAFLFWASVFASSASSGYSGSS